MEEATNINSKGYEGSYTSKVRNSLTSGNMWGSMWRLTWPMLIFMLLNFLVGFIDIYVAGLISRDVQAAIGYVAQLFFLFIILANAISVGTVALVSRAFGAHAFVKAAEYAKQSLILGFIISVMLMGLGLLFHGAIVKIAGFPDQIRTMAETLLIIFSFALGSNYLLIISNGIFRASGEVIKPLTTMFVFCVVNIALDFALVFGIGPIPSLGYKGIGLATATAATVSMIISLLLFLTGRWRRMVGSPWRIKSETIFLVAKYGWPSGMLQVAWNASSIVIYHILSQLNGQSITALAAFANGTRIEAIIFMPAFAMNMAASVLVGQNLGAGNPDRAAQLGWRIASAGVIILSIFSCIIFMNAESLAYLLTRQASVLAETALYLKIAMISEPFMALSLVLGGALQGAGDTRGNMWVIIFCLWIIRLPLAFTLAILFGLGTIGVWISMAVSMSFQGMLMAYRFKRGKWKTLKIEGLSKVT